MDAVLSYAGIRVPWTLAGEKTSLEGRQLQLKDLNELQTKSISNNAIHTLYKSLQTNR